MSLWKSQPWIVKSCRKFPGINAQRRSIPRGEISHLGKTMEREVLGCYPKMSLRRTGVLPARTRKIGHIGISLEEPDRAWGRSTDREGEREHLFGYIASLIWDCNRDDCWFTCSSGGWQRSEQVGTTPVEIIRQLPQVRWKNDRQIEKDARQTWESEFVRWPLL